MNRAQQAFRFFLALTTMSILSSAKAAEATPPKQPSSADCNAVAGQTSDDPAVKNVLDQSKLLCAQKNLADIQGQVDALKTQKIVAALTAIGTIPGMTGAITQPEKADHIGDLLAQRMLYAAAMKVRAELGTSIESFEVLPPYVLLTDPDTSKTRLLVISSVATLRGMAEAMNDLKRQASNTPLTAPKPPDSKAKALYSFAPQLLTVLPPLISAAEGIAGILKTESTLSALSTKPKAEVILAGLTGTANTNLVLPAYRVSLDANNNEFWRTYKDTFAAYLALRPVPADMQNKIDGLDKNQHASANYLALKKHIEGQLAEFESLKNSYMKIPEGKSTSQFDDLIAAAATIDASAAGILMVTASHFGGNGGIIKSKWTDDRLTYDNSVLLTYLLVNNRGFVLRAGTASCSISFTSTLKNIDENLNSALRGTPTCLATSKGDQTT